MVKETVEFNLDGLMRLRSAALDFAEAEVSRIVRVVIDDLRDRPAKGMFGDVTARHIWDEYCWSLQEGPFDVDTDWDGVELGSVSGAFDEMVRAIIEGEIEKLPRHAQIFLSAKAIENDPDMDEDLLGSIWPDGMVALIAEKVDKMASRRDLDLIGPDRGDVIGSVIEGEGAVWSVLSDRGEVMDLVRPYASELIDPKGDLSELASEMIDAYLNAVTEEADGPAISELLDRFEGHLRELLKEGDVLPALEDIRHGLLERLDQS